MDFISGVKITDVDAISAAGLDRDDIARRFMKAIIKQLLIDGFFHADPHPGNVFVDTADGTIVFLDLGLIGQLTRDQRFDLMDLMWSVVQQDSAGIAAVMTRMSVAHGPVDPAAVRRAVDQVVFQYLKFADNGGDFGAAISNILSSLYDNGLRLNQNFTLAIKAIVQVEEITNILSPGFDFLALGVADARDLMVTEISPERISASLQQTVIQTGKELARRVPDLQTAAIGWIDQFQKGKVVVEISTADLNTELGKLGLIGRALAAGMILAGVIIATGIVFTATLLADRQLTFILPVPFLLLILFVGLLVVGLREARGLLRGDPIQNDEANG
jgi:ubiquinone biosynthesis protein